MEGYKWVEHNTGSNFSPETAVLAGIAPNGKDIYVGRVFHGDDIIPAEIILEDEVAYCSWGGKEHEKKEFQVLCRRRFAWVASSNGLVPEHAVVAGKAADDESLYVGRVSHNGSYSVGKVQPSHQCLYIPDEGKELSFKKDYDILIFH